MNFTNWIFVYAFAAIGHMAIWIALFNRLHSTSLNNRLIRRASYPFFALNLFALPFLLAWFDSSWDPSMSLMPRAMTDLNGVFGGYIWFCLAMSGCTLLGWSSRKLSQRRQVDSLVGYRASEKDFSQFAEAAQRSGTEKFFAAIPGNQIYRCVVEDREIRLNGISKGFDGMTITHLSDFHFTGKICREYFEQVIKTANELNSDLILITGDIIDSKECWDWLPEVLGKLRARQGVYFILGNHDERAKAETELRQSLEQLGFIDASDRWISIRVDNQFLHIAGNELPWFGKSMTLGELPDHYSYGDLRILMSHSPDQWKWARKHGFDLVLAGHTHGGQINIPIVGPVISPSRHGVKYASGMFEKDGKVMVVSRGISGEEPLRFNCPPEVGKITLRTNG